MARAASTTAKHRLETPVFNKVRRTPSLFRLGDLKAEAITKIIRLVSEAQNAAWLGDQRSAKLNQAKIAQGSQNERAL